MKLHEKVMVAELAFGICCCAFGCVYATVGILQENFWAGVFGFGSASLGSSFMALSIGGLIGAVIRRLQ